MKKYFVYGVAALALVSCSNEILIDEAKQDAKDIEIAFETFAENATKAENSTASYDWVFYNHHTTFQVWGYKNTSTTKVFDGEVVTASIPASAMYTLSEYNTAKGLDGSTTEKTPLTEEQFAALSESAKIKTAGVYQFVYEPVRFWDKAASKYEYYAAAPKDGWTFKDGNIANASSQDKGYFETSSTLADHTLTSTTYENSFKSIASTIAIDKMIASPASVSKAAFGQTVQFHFNHILSRLNITIQKDEVLDAYEVKMVSLAVKNLNGKGSFSEENAAVVTGSNARWSGQETPINYTAVANVTVPKSDATPALSYVLQSLVVPQDVAYEEVALDGNARAEVAATAAVLYTYAEYKALAGHSDISETDFNNLPASDKTKTPAIAAVPAANAISADSKPYLVITYTIKPTNGTAEEFTAYYNLAAAFGKTTGESLAFNEGWQNTLKIKLQPSKIEFCADVASWADAAEETLTVK